MNDKLPTSLNRFAAELEQAIARELGPRRGGRLGRVLRARPRLLAGTTIGAAGTGAVLAFVLTAAGSSPAFAVTRHRDGSYSVTLRAVSAIPAANATLARMGVRVRLMQVRADCPGASAPAKNVATSPAAFSSGGSNTVIIKRAWARAQKGGGPRPRSNQVLHWRQVAVPVCAPPPPGSCAQGVTASPASGSSGNKAVQALSRNGLPANAAACWCERPGNSANVVEPTAISVKPGWCTVRLHRVPGGGKAGNSGKSGSR